MECSYCGVDNSLTVDDLMSRLMDGQLLTTLELERLQGFITEPEPTVCSECKPQVTLNWQAFPQELLV